MPRKQPIQTTADAVDDQSIRVLHLTDPHLFADADGALRGVTTAASLQLVIEHYAAGDWRADRVVVTGDLIQDGSPGAYDRFRELMLPLNMRMHCLPGNHDIRDLMRKVCGMPPFSYCAYEEIHDWLIISLDSCISGEAGGKIMPDELNRLADIVDSSSAKHVMVCLHHPPMPIGSAWLDKVGLQNGDEVLQRMQSLDSVRLVVFGHAHQSFDAEHHGIRVIGTPSTCRQFLPGSNQFAVDDRPPAYRRITLHADGSIDNDLIWVDA